MRLLSVGLWTIIFMVSEKDFINKMSLAFIIAKVTFWKWTDHEVTQLFHLESADNLK